MQTRILLVEDSPTQAEALRSLLADSYDVTVAGSGEDALRLITADAFELVLSDVMMPGITGYELCRQIKADPDKGDLPVMLLTSLSNPMNIVRGLECGADNYVTKPYDPDALLTRVARVLENARMRRNARFSTGVNVSFLGTTFKITSEKEQILDLLLSSVEDVVRTNSALEQSQRQLAEAHAQLESFAREKAREARASTERYRMLMQNASDAIFVLDRAGKILEANTTAEELVGSRNGGKVLFRDLLVPGEEEEFEAALRGLEAGKASIERHLLLPDGRTIVAEISASVTSLEDEDLVLAIVHDVTERREAARSLEESEQRYRSLFEYNPDPVFSVDTAGVFQSANPACARITGWSLDELLGTRFDRLVLPGQLAEARSFFIRAVKGEPQSYQTAIRHKDGRPIELDITNLPVIVGGEIQGVFGIAKDVTAKREAEATLRETEEQLRQAQKLEAIGRLAGGIAHDFNNLLGVIAGNAQLLEQDLHEGTANAEDLGEILRASERAAALTRQLLAFSRKQILQPHIVNLNDIIVEVSRMLKRVIGEDLHLETELKPDLEMIEVDPNQMHQVLMNLAVNARDAMPGGGTLRISTDQAELSEADVKQLTFSVKPGPHVRLHVSDTGSGMEPEVLSQIFDPFFTTKEAGKGTGLGLSTVYGIVQQSGGYLTVNSSPGKGTRFTIGLPRADGVERHSTIAGELEALSLEGRTVLLVEDEQSLRRVVRRMLEQTGFKVIEATDGEDALRACREDPCPLDLLLTDIVMPHLSGPDLAAALVEENQDLRLVYMSGYTDETLRRHEMLDRSALFLEKPFTSDQLRAVLMRAFAEPDLDGELA